MNMNKVANDVRHGVVITTNVAMSVVGAIGYTLTAWSKKPEKKKSKTVEYLVKVAGVTMGDEGRQDNIKALKGGEKLKLVPHDGVVDNDGNPRPNAVAVMNGDSILGHLPDRDGPNKISRARMIRDKWRKGKDVEIISWNKRGSSTTPRIGLEIKIRNDR